MQVGAQDCAARLPSAPCPLPPGTQAPGQQLDRGSGVLPRACLMERRVAPSPSTEDTSFLVRVWASFISFL